MYVVRVGHLYATLWWMPHRYVLALPSVKKPREWRQKWSAEKMAHYYRKYHGLGAVVEEV